VRVTGRLLFGDDAVPFSGGSAQVTLEDTTYADARAVVLGSWQREGVSYPADADWLAFEIVVDSDPSQPGRRRTLRAFVDADGDHALGPGDYLNVEAVPVTSEGGAFDVRIKRYTP
jgi:hypothetical protein